MSLSIIALLPDVFIFNRFDRHQAVVPRSEWGRFEPLDQGQFRTLFIEVVREASPDKES